MDMLQLLRIITLCSIISTAIIVVRAALDYYKVYLGHIRQISEGRRDVEALGQAARSMVAAIDANAPKRAKLADELP